MRQNAEHESIGTTIINFEISSLLFIQTQNSGIIKIINTEISPTYIENL